MSTIRKVQEHEFNLCTDLSQYAFQYTLSAEQREERKPMLREMDIWGDFEGETLLSKLHVLPLSVWMEGREIPMGGIAGVATWPEHRRKGSVSRLLKHALFSMKENGQVLSFLHPFSIPFYRKYGWEVFASLKKCLIEPNNFHIDHEVSGYVRRGSKKEQKKLLQDVYEAYAKQYNGMLKRSDNWWETRVHPEGYEPAIYWNEDSVPTGYMLYKIADRMMDVQEYVYLDENARRGLWNFVCQHDSMVDKVKIVMPEDNPFPFLLHNPKIQQEVFPYFMGRVVDLPAFLRMCPIVSGSERIVFHVTDEAAPWNSGTYELQNGEVMFHEERLPNEGLTADIQTMTALLFGYQRPSFLHACGKLTGSAEDVRRLETAMPRSQTSFLDFF